MARPPAFQFYPADFLADENVVLMSLPEVGAYIKLLCFCWREGSLPSNVDSLARLVGCDGSAMASYMAKLSACFIERDGRLFNSRLEKELQKQVEFHSERSEAGKAGAKARWGKKMHIHSKAIAEPIAEPMRSQWLEPMAKNASSSSSSNNTPIVPFSFPDHLKRFDTREVHDASRAWISQLAAKKKPPIDPHQTILAAVQSYKTPEEYIQAVWTAIRSNWGSLQPADPKAISNHETSQPNDYA